MKKNILIILIALLLLVFFGFLILGYGYGGGKGVKPISFNNNMKLLEKQIKKEVQSDIVIIREPRNYELDNCSGHLKQEINLNINNENLKNKDSLDKYSKSIALRIKKIFPYKDCFDSILIKTSYYNVSKDSIIKYKYTFPIK